MRQVLLIVGGALVGLAIVIGGLTLSQANGEELALSADLQYRTHTLADSLVESLEPAVNAQATSSVQRVVDRIAASQGVVGLGIFSASSTLISRSAALPDTDPYLPLVIQAIGTDDVASLFRVSGTHYRFVFAEPLHRGDAVSGVLVIVQNADYIQTAVWKIWLDNLWRLLVLSIIFGGAFFVLVRWVFLRPLSQMAEAMAAVRKGRGADVSALSHELFHPLSSEIVRMTQSLQHARASASEEARMRLEELDSPWTAARLAEFVKAQLKGRPIFVVSNREPYLHHREDGTVRWMRPAGGAVTALESVMEACGGMWIAHGSGDADKETADQDGKLAVPPDEPKYALKRVWLSDDEVKGYYTGFSNEALWPLCHQAHIRPIFRQEDWKAYRAVNGAFAKALLQEMRHVERPLVLVQDYHLALLPELIKRARPDAQIAIFWHIPWPSASAFSICPWRKELLDGILGADIIGFHTQQYCNDFLDTVSAEIEARIDLEHFSVTRAEHTSYIKPFPISIAYPGDAEPRGAPDREAPARYGVKTEFALGVDRLDYTKGIVERFKGLECFFAEHPEYLGKFALLQIASPSRESVEKYRQYSEEVAAEAARINAAIGTGSWKPIILVRRNLSRKELVPLYQLAKACVITSLHDGMNLVAKEFVAARTEEDGVLILSQFTGAARDLKAALIVNPYSAEETAAALYAAVTMSPTEQHQRMKALRESVSDYNVFRWAAELIKALTRIG